jgi:signal transduction histidine kinase
MNFPTIARNVTKPGSYAFSTHQLRTLIPNKIVEKKPDQFASALAHEIRNPLTNINLAADMLKSTLITDDQKIYLDIITRASARINNLTADLLAYYQTDEVLVENYSVHQLIDDVLATTIDRIKLKNITVRKYYTLLDAKILVNKQNMKMALTNILINAIDAMSSKNGELSLITKSMNGKCIVEINDNGIGISKENLKNIFKPYFSNKPGGMGLGLSTTLNILQSNHVAVNVQSEEGSGTTFILSFKKIS